MSSYLLPEWLLALIEGQFGAEGGGEGLVFGGFGDGEGLSGGFHGFFETTGLGVGGGEGAEDAGDSAAHGIVGGRGEPHGFLAIAEFGGAAGGEDPCEVVCCENGCRVKFEGFAIKGDGA